MGFKENITVGFSVLLVGGGAAISAEQHHPSHMTTAGAAIASISPDAGVPGGTYVHPHAAGGYVDPIPHSPVEPPGDRRYLSSGPA